jgi:hypothetical protein
VEVEEYLLLEAVEFMEPIIIQARIDHQNGPHRYKKMPTLTLVAPTREHLLTVADRYSLPLEINEPAWHLLDRVLETAANTLGFTVNPQAKTKNDAEEQVENLRANRHSKGRTAQAHVEDRNRRGTDAFLSFQRELDERAARAQKENVTVGEVSNKHVN